jgi:hypothetical protein
MKEPPSPPSCKVLVVLVVLDVTVVLEVIFPTASVISSVTSGSSVAGGGVALGSFEPPMIPRSPPLKSTGGSSVPPLLSSPLPLPFEVVVVVTDTTVVVGVVNVDTVDVLVAWLVVDVEMIGAAPATTIYTIEQQEQRVYQHY